MAILKGLVPAGGSGITFRMPNSRYFFYGLMDEEDEEVLIRLNFDGCKHDSGDRRLWGTCPNKAHKRCFRYERLLSVALALWSLEPFGPLSFTLVLLPPWLFSPNRPFDPFGPSVSWPFWPLGSLVPLVPQPIGPVQQPVDGIPQPRGGFAQPRGPAPQPR